MALSIHYTFTKAKGRVSIWKHGKFDHQQFKTHWAYYNPQGYIEWLAARDAEANANAAAERAARKVEAEQRAADRAARIGGIQLAMF